MKHLSCFAFLLLASFVFSRPVAAQRFQPIVSPTPPTGGTVTPTPVVQILPTVTPKEDITQPTKETKGRLERVIEERQIGPLSATNVVQTAIRQAVSQGVPANTIVLLLLFPIVATMVAAARHLLGLRGFGVFTPALIAVTFLATGLRLGITLFVTLLIVATVGRMAIRYLRLQYLPQVSQLILLMSLGMIGLLLLSPYLAGVSGGFFGFDRLISIGIFPVLILTLLTESFINAQILHGVKRATNITIETLILASVSYLVLNMPNIQEWVLTNPETTIVAIAAVNIILGRFTGLRILEYWRFRELLKK